jgi:transposase
MQYVGIDWGTRKAAWCAVDGRGMLREGIVPADEDGLARLVHTLGPEVRGCMEMMSGAVWVRERLCACGWEFQIADARKVKAIAPLACKTDQVDARVLAQLARRDLVPEVWVPSLSDRELRERLRRRAHLVRLKTSARNRMFGLLTQWGLRGNLKMLRQPGSLRRLSARGVPAAPRVGIAAAPYGLRVEPDPGSTSRIGYPHLTQKLGQNRSSRSTESYVPSPALINESSYCSRSRESASCSGSRSPLRSARSPGSRAPAS